MNTFAMVLLAGLFASWVFTILIVVDRNNRYR